MKYIIDIPDTGYVSKEDGQLYVPLKSADCDVSINPTWLVTGYHCEPYAEPDRKAIEDEVWEFASRLMTMHPDVAEDIYWSMNGGKGIGVAAEMTYQEAKAKYDAWKKEKEEIHVGDEVKHRGLNYVVGYVGADQVYHLIDKNWLRTVVQGGYQLIKTGRHFDEVEELLKKMSEDT